MNEQKRVRRMNGGKMHLNVTRWVGMCQFDVEVMSRGKGKLAFNERVIAKPWQLDRLLKPLRYAMRTMRGNERREYVRGLFASFRRWLEVA
jgi:hypothetical protein